MIYDKLSDNKASFEGKHQDLSFLWWIRYLFCHDHNDCIILHLIHNNNTNTSLFGWKWYRDFILIIISSISIKISEFPRKSSLLSFLFEFLLSYIVILSVSFRNERLLTYINQTCACWHNYTLSFTLDDRDSRPFNSSYRRDQFSRGRGPYDMSNRSIFYSQQWIYPFSFLSLERTYNSEQGFPKYFYFLILFYIDCDSILCSKRVSDHADINRRKYKTIIPTDVCYLLVLNYCFFRKS